MGKRQDSRERIEAGIIDVGRRHLATEGAAGLSLRAIARELGMVSSAVYRYVASRDDLLTLLLVDSYSDLAEAVGRARDADAQSWRDQILAIGSAVRRWAVAEPARWALLYGSPVPGYHAPAAETVGPGTRVVAMLFDAVGHGIDAGDIKSSKNVTPQNISTDFDAIRSEFGFRGDDEVVTRCFAVWAGLIGAVSLEVFGQYGADTLTDPTAAFEAQLRLLVELLAGDCHPN